MNCIYAYDVVQKAQHSEKENMIVRTKFNTHYLCNIDKSLYQLRSQYSFRNVGTIRTFLDDYC